jgi:hypothetical protein
MFESTRFLARGVRGETPGLKRNQPMLPVAKCLSLEPFHSVRLDYRQATSK